MQAKNPELLTFFTDVKGEPLGWIAILLAPAAAEDAAVETRFGPSTVGPEFTVFVDLGFWSPGHVGDFQVFNREHLAISVINQGVGNLMGNARRDIA